MISPTLLRSLSSADIPPNLHLPACESSSADNEKYKSFFFSLERSQWRLNYEGRDLRCSWVMLKMLYRQWGKIRDYRFFQIWTVECGEGGMWQTLCSVATRSKGQPRWPYDNWYFSLIHWVCKFHTSTLLWCELNSRGHVSLMSA